MGNMGQCVWTHNLDSVECERRRLVHFDTRHMITPQSQRSTLFPETVQALTTVGIVDD